MEVSPGFVTSKYVLGISDIYHGHVSASEATYVPRYVGDIDRSIRCVPSHSNSDGALDISMFSAR